MMDLARGCRAKHGLHEFDGVGIGFNSDPLLIIKLPDSRVMRIISRSLFLAVILLALPSIGSIMRGLNDASYDADLNYDLSDFMMLPILFRDLMEEGLLKKGQKGLIGSSGFGDLVEDSEFWKQRDIELVMECDLNHKDLIPDETFDFAITSSFWSSSYVDRVLKNGGIVVVQLDNYPSNELQRYRNYKIVYLRRFQSTVVAMKKTDMLDSSAKCSDRNTLCRNTPEAKKTALKGLEDVLLEPPRRALAKSTNGSRKMKFLPELLGDFLESYPRRIFIADKENDVVDWFYRNYPTRSQDFEIYNMEVETVGSGGLSEVVVPPVVGLSDWFRSNIREEDYVVMKAEAQLVEEMLRKKTICLVDELFLECKHHWEDGEENDTKTKRTYWQCLALYGKLRDEGVAVHQWWS